MGFFEAWILAVGLGFGLFYGLSTLGREIRSGLVDAAKVARSNVLVYQPPSHTPDIPTEKDL